ncbi:MAG: CBS domain-containing protein [Candidatus Marinimicrobia bacterium]|jgi:CBS domain-containing protein|nr:CBS domain-containing protein [Candidatus Neomarinimicrobiota bacterium]MDP7512431.1 CBS domain-containing protein [Candidatus Neomarinimicrobiota bacterium]HJL63331.1 CBS domain-containing protein [Candidatus Neomarinimicrobiota bacterium]|tara:strand:- start:288 stop:827 length:540 start_codon:yes stop_codon:yes gene_type:complete
MQENQFDDELKRMDELEYDASSGIEEGVSLDDPLSGLALKNPIVVNIGTPLSEAVQKLQDKSLGCLLVESDGKLAGIMTERDILLKVTGKGLDFEKEVVDNFMTPNPEYLEMEDAVAYALNRMVVSGFRHVPIVDDNKKSVGVVSLVNIVQQVATALGEEIFNLPPIPQRKGFSRPEGG